MATVAGHGTIVTMGRETTYGTVFLTPTVKLPDMFEYSFGDSQVTVPQKTQTLEGKVKTSQSGRKSPTVTLSGVLTYAGHEELLKAFFGQVTGTPYVFMITDVAISTAGYSYTIACTVPTATSNLGKGVVALGCRLETLEISRNGDYVGYTATFRAKSIDDQATHSWVLSGLTDTDSTYPELAPFLWQDVVVSLIDDGQAAANTFSLTLTNTFADDDINFQNKQTKQKDYKCSSGGVLTAEFLYDVTADAIVYDNILNQTCYADQIILYESGDATDYWTIATEGQYIEYSKPDKENCIYVSSYTKQLMGDGDNKAISIAIT